MDTCPRCGYVGVLRKPFLVNDSMLSSLRRDPILFSDPIFCCHSKTTRMNNARSPTIHLYNYQTWMWNRFLDIVERACRFATQTVRSCQFSLKNDCEMHGNLVRLKNTCAYNWIEWLHWKLFLSACTQDLNQNPFRRHRSTLTYEALVVSSYISTKCVFTK